MQVLFMNIFVNFKHVFFGQQHLQIHTPFQSNVEHLKVKKQCLPVCQIRFPALSKLFLSVVQVPIEISSTQLCQWKKFSSFLQQHTSLSVYILVWADNGLGAAYWWSILFDTRLANIAHLAQDIGAEWPIRLSWRSTKVESKKYVL